MIESRGGFSFALKALKRLGIPPQIFWEKFQGDGAIQPRIFGFVNHAHAAADFFQNAVVRNGLA
jgi:hypothetical protein